MTIEELAHITKTRIDIAYVPESRSFSAGLADLRVVGNGVLTTDYGRGKTLDEALADYAKKLAGKTVRARDYAARPAGEPYPIDEYPVPATLKHEPLGT